jgi:hypothetical protein
LKLKEKRTKGIIYMDKTVISKIEREQLRGKYVLGFGSVRSDDSESMTLYKDRAGLQAFFNMSKQIPP